MAPAHGLISYEPHITDSLHHRVAPNLALTHGHRARTIPWRDDDKERAGRRDVWPRRHAIGGALRSTSVIILH